MKIYLDTRSLGRGASLRQLVAATGLTTSQVSGVLQRFTTGKYQEVNKSSQAITLPGLKPRSGFVYWLSSEGVELLLDADRSKYVKLFGLEESVEHT